MNNGILSAIGNTPVIRLSRLFEDNRFRLYAKLEALNPGGSMKDRPALKMLRQALDSGMVNEHSVIIESSSGNMGIGLAQACSYFGLRFICVVDPKTTVQNLAMMKAYGADLEFVMEPDALTGEFLKARIDRVKQLVGQIPNSFWPNQYANASNSDAHRETMREIVEAIGEQIDFLFCATSTCGTLRGCTEFIRDNGLRTKVIAVDAHGSVIFGGIAAKRLIPGHGAAIRPPLFRPDLADEAIHVSDLDCVIGCRSLARREAILAGGSSGAVVSAVEKVRRTIPDGSTVAMILADRGERYLDTIYSDEWVYEHFGEVAAIITEPTESELCAVVS
jgi:cysteine synthase A